MASLNKVTLIGRVGRDLEVKTFDNGNKIATFTLATSEVYTDRNGQRQESTEWFNLVLNGKMVDSVGPFIHKGSNLYVEGKIHTRSWDDQNVQKQYRTEIVVFGLQLLDPKPQQPQAQQQPQPQPQFAQPTYSAPQPHYQQYGGVAQPPMPQAPQPQQPPMPPRPQQPPMQQQLDPNNYPGDLPF